MPILNDLSKKLSEVAQTTVQAVSYTHLDVYKRQAPESATPPGRNFPYICRGNGGSRYPARWPLRSERYMLPTGPFPKVLPASESPAGLRGTFPLAKAGKTDPAARQWATRRKRPTPGKCPKTIWKASTATPTRENGPCPAKYRFPPHRPCALPPLRRPGLLPSPLPLPAKQRCPGGGPEALRTLLAGRDETGFFRRQHCKTLQTPALLWYSLPSTPKISSV